MKYKTSKPIQWLARAASVVMWDQFRYPQPVKDVYDVADNTFEKLKWAYRCWVHQLETAEKYSGIEAYFSEHRMEFSLPEDFQVQTEIALSAASWQWSVFQGRSRMETTGNRVSSFES